MTGALLCAEAQGAGLESLERAFSTGSEAIPSGLLLGGAAYYGTVPVVGEDPSRFVVPGFIYTGENWQYLGDRLRYVKPLNQDMAVYGYGRVRGYELDPSDNAALAGMHKRQYSLEGGLGLHVKTDMALLTFRAGTDVSGRSNGTELAVFADFPFVYNDRWMVVPSVGLFARDKNLNQYYYGGVGADEAAPGRPAYSPGATLTPNASVVATYLITKHWYVAGLVSYEAYASKVKNSPIIDKSGEWDLLLATGYRWH